MKNGRLKKNIIVTAAIIGSLWAGATFYEHKHQEPLITTTYKQQVNRAEKSITQEFKKAQSFYNEFEAEILKVMEDEFQINGIEQEMKYTFLTGVTEEAKMDVLKTLKSGEELPKQEKVEKQYYDRVDKAIDEYAEHMDILNATVYDMIVRDDVDKRRESGNLYGGYEMSENFDNFEERFATGFLSEVMLNNEIYQTAEQLKEAESEKDHTKETIKTAVIAGAGMLAATGAGLYLKDSDKRNKQKKLNNLLREMEDDEMER